MLLVTLFYIASSAKSLTRGGASPDEPDAPGRPIVTDWDSDFVELEWTKPRHDGGAPITGYIIQKKAKGSPIWQNAARVPADKTKVGTIAISQANDCWNNASYKSRSSLRSGHC